MYAKARTTLQHIRRDPVLDERGLPLLSARGQAITIDKYPHLVDYGLFGEDTPVYDAKPEGPPPAMNKYKVDPITGNPIPVLSDAPDSDDDTFSGVSFNPGMSSKSR